MGAGAGGDPSLSRPRAWGFFRDILAEGAVRPALLVAWWRRWRLQRKPMAALRGARRAGHQRSPRRRRCSVAPTSRYLLGAAARVAEGGHSAGVALEGLGAALAGRRARPVPRRSSRTAGHGGGGGGGGRRRPVIGNKERDVVESHLRHGSSLRLRRHDDAGVSMSRRRSGSTASSAFCSASLGGGVSAGSSTCSAKPVAVTTSSTERPGGRCRAAARRARRDHAEVGDELVGPAPGSRNARSHRPRRCGIRSRWERPRLVRRVVEDDPGHQIGDVGEREAAGEAHDPPLGLDPARVREPSPPTCAGRRNWRVIAWRSAISIVSRCGT